MKTLQLTDEESQLLTNALYHLTILISNQDNRIATGNLLTAVKQQLEAQESKILLNKIVSRNYDGKQFHATTEPLDSTTSAKIITMFQANKSNFGIEGSDDDVLEYQFWDSQHMLQRYYHPNGTSDIQRVKEFGSNVNIQLTLRELNSILGD